MTSDPDLHDPQLETEIKLVGDLVLAASQSEQHLTDERIDEVLGLRAREAPAGAGGDGEARAVGDGEARAVGDGEARPVGDGEEE